jgi:hypothetical protein
MKLKYSQTGATDAAIQACGFVYSDSIAVDFDQFVLLRFNTNTTFLVLPSFATLVSL